MAFLSTKLKIIIVIFAIVAGLYAIQYAVTSITNASKRESFVDESDETPNVKEPIKTNEAKNDKQNEENDASQPKEEPASKDSKDPKDSELKLEILDKVENIMNNFFPDSFDQKASMFNSLTKAEHFQQIKERYIDGLDINELITSKISSILGKPKPIREDEETIDEFVNDAENNTSCEARLSKVIPNIEHIEKDLNKIVNKLHSMRNNIRESCMDRSKPKHGSSASPAPPTVVTPKPPSTTVPSSPSATKTSTATAPSTPSKPTSNVSHFTNGPPVIEGFENRIAYAFF